MSLENRFNYVRLLDINFANKNYHMEGLHGGLNECSEQLVFCTYSIQNNTQKNPFLAAH